MLVRSSVRSAASWSVATRSMALSTTIQDHTLRPTSLAGTIGGVLDAQVTKNHMKRAVEIAEVTDAKYSYGQLKYHVDGFAAGLLQYRFAPGDSIAIAMSNKIEKVVLLLAAAKLGLTVVPLNLAPTREELRQALDLGVKGLVFTDKVDNTNYVHEIQDLVPELISSADAVSKGIPFRSRQYPNLRHVFNSGRVRASGMTRLQWLPSYSADSDLVRTTQTVDDRSNFILDLSTKKTYAQGDILVLAKKAFDLPPNSIVSVATPLNTAAAYAAGSVAVQLNGALGLYSMGPDPIQELKGRPTNALVTDSNNVSGLGQFKSPLVAVVIANSSDKSVEARVRDETKSHVVSLA